MSEDNNYEESEIVGVSINDSGWTIERADGFSFFVPGDSPITPLEGMTARFYGRGIGSTVRGLFLDGIEVFYRNEKEEKIHHDIQMYGKDATDWLDRWDANKGVWSIEMGGLGPGYEQAIQVTAAEILRHLLAENYSSVAWENSDEWKKDRDAIQKFSFEDPVIKSLGLSGAQWGAALSLATKFYMDGPIKIMNTEEIKDRHIQVNKNFPQEA